MPRQSVAFWRAVTICREQVVALIDLRVLPGAILVRQTPDVHALIQRALSTISPGAGYYGGMVPATLNESPIRVSHPASN